MELEKMLSENPDALVVSVGGVLVADSLAVADRFGKSHNHVLRDIGELILQLERDAVESGCPKLDSEKYFIEDSYENRGKSYKRYLMTRDGFSLLVMGFTGLSAFHWKLAYIEAFNKMEERIRNKPIDIESLVSKVTTEAVSQVLKEVLPVVKKQVPTDDGEGRRHHSRRIVNLLGNKEALPPFLGVYDMRDYLGIGQKKAYELIHAEGFPKYLVGTEYRIPRDEFLEWVEITFRK